MIQAPVYHKISSNSIKLLARSRKNTMINLKYESTKLKEKEVKETPRMNVSFEHSQLKED